MAAMTVKKLRAELKKFEQDAIIVLSSDGEGNSYSPMPEEGFFSLGTYSADNTWSGEFHSDTKEEHCDEGWESDEEDDDEEETGGVRAVVLWPTN